jgi:hypothetical protein
MTITLITLAISISLNLYLAYRIYHNHTATEVNYEATAEIIYKFAFVFMALLVTGIIGINYLFGYSEIEPIQIDESILDFAKNNLFLFVIPITVKLIGDKIPDVTNLLLAMRGISHTRREESQTHPTHPTENQGEIY